MLPFLIGVGILLASRSAGRSPADEVHNDINDIIDPVPKSPTFKTWDPITDKVIATLDPSAQPKFAAAVNELDKVHGIKYRLYEGYRSIARSNELYAAYIAKKGPRAAPGGKSFHNYRLAADGVEIIGGKADWKYKNFAIIEKVVNKYGLHTGAAFGDKPHWEDRSRGKESELFALYNAGKVKDGYVVTA